MHLARFNAFADEVRHHAQFGQRPRVASISRRHEDKWYSDQGPPCAAGAAHDQCININEPIQITTHRWLYPVKPLSTVIEFEFGAKPRTKTREAISKTIRKALEDSDTKYKASHDTVTGLLNKPTTESELLEFSNALLTNTPTDSAGSPEARPILCVGIADIDHFKQINDNHGHMYGDVVLLAFAAKLSRFVRDLNSRDSVQRAIVGRVGGEEFLIAVLATATAAECKSWLDDFRADVASELLPTSGEWNRLEKEDRTGGIALPHDGNRRVSASIGISTLASTTATDASRDIQRLRSEADTALYRAKAGGRNLVTVFSDIMGRHGRVLEHHAETDTVVADIGTNVGVLPGQEFIVYHPQFCGDVPYTFNDGRTNRILGSYPKRALGRVIIFDAQAEISFSDVSERRITGSKFPVGARLEAVPLGSFGHLLPAATVDVGGYRLAPPDDLKAAITSRALEGKSFTTAVLTIEDTEQLITSHGTAYANKMLARSCIIVYDKLPKNCIVSQIAPTELAFFVPSTDGIRETLDAIVTTARAESRDVVRYVVGYASSASLAHPTANMAFALDMARFAVSPAAKVVGKGVTAFSLDVARQVIQTLRRQRRHTQALIDYRLIAKMDIHDSDVENYAGLCALEMSPADVNFAIDRFSTAVSIDPNPSLYMHANLALALLMDNKVQESIASFRSAIALSDEKISDIYMTAYAKACALAYRFGMPSALSIDETRSLLRVAISVPPSGYFTKVVTLGELQAEFEHLERSGHSRAT